MSPFDIVAMVAVFVGGSCLADVLRRLRLPGLLPRRDWVVNAELSGLSLCVTAVMFDLLAHWAAAHAGGLTSPAGPFSPPS
jgi:hypothetical protein